MTDFIPNPDAQALIWMQAFAAGIAANPPLYMLTTPDATAISAAVSAFDTALAASSNPATRTPVTIAAKDGARAAGESICRQFAILIKYNAGVSDPDKIAIGVRPVNPAREPIDCPQTSPLLNVIAATPGQQTLRYADSMTPDSPAKPFGASELQLFVAIGTAAVTDPAQATFYGKFSRNPVAVDFAAADNGKQATYFARWASRRGQTGPWSLPVTMAIAA
ncbi:MAG TPA: hypothetical protein VH475_04330 [Tepidisphaeraceae bacterium]